MKIYKKMAIIGLILLVVFIITATIGINKIYKQIQDDQNSYKKNVGIRIVCEKDTVSVVDYSIIKETYTLSNGKEVAKTFLEKATVVK